MARPVISVLILVASVFPTTAGELRLQEGRSAIRDDWADRVERARQDSARFVGAAVDTFRLRQIRMPRGTPDAGSMRLRGTYLDDPTLRYGDVIAIEGRLIVFRGGGAPPHRSAEFEEIGKAGTLGGIHDRELRDLNDTLARSGTSPTSDGSNRPEKAP